MNRFFRRMERFGKSFSARRSQGTMANKENDLLAAGTPPDVTSVRAKSMALTDFYLALALFHLGVGVTAVLCGRLARWLGAAALGLALLLGALT